MKHARRKFRPKEEGPKRPFWQELDQLAEGQPFLLTGLKSVMVNAKLGEMLVGRPATWAEAVRVATEFRLLKNSLAAQGWYVALVELD